MFLENIFLNVILGLGNKYTENVNRRKYELCSKAKKLAATVNSGF
jgi:hypothetical protein